MCGGSEAAARLKQLELESSPLLAAPRNNMNVNVAMNNQASVCVISSKIRLCLLWWRPAALLCSSLAFSINKHMCGTAWWSLCDIWPNRTMWWSSQRSAGWTVRAAVHAWLRCAPRRIWRVTSWRLKPRRPRSRCATDRGVKKRALRCTLILLIHQSESLISWAVFS